VAISSCDKHRSQQSNPTQRARHSQASSSTEAWKLVKSCPVAKSSSLQLQLQLQEEETEPTAQPKLVAVRPVPQEMTLSSSHTAHFGRSLSGSRRGSLLFSFPLRCDKPNGDTADPQSGRNGRLNSHHAKTSPEPLSCAQEIRASGKLLFLHARKLVIASLPSGRQGKKSQAWPARRPLRLDCGASTLIPPCLVSRVRLRLQSRAGFCFTYAFAFGDATGALIRSS
jgi:hypothetical protein